MKSNIIKLAVAGALLVGAQGASAAAAYNNCKDLLSKAGTGGSGSTDYAKFAANVVAVTSGSSTHKASGITSTALKNPMWVTLVANDGVVCAVVGGDGGSKPTAAGTGVGTGSWLLSRVISAQKAYTANGLSTATAAITTGSLYGSVQPDTGSLFGLSDSNPVNAALAYSGTTSAFGTSKDPLNGKIIGGVNTFGGGLPLYSASGTKVGAIGVSGDTSCEDHAVAWKIRAAIALDKGPDDTLDISVSGHPKCGAANAAALGGASAGWKD